MNIKLYCQPAYNYKTNEIEYLEVLIREYGELCNTQDIINKYNTEENSLSFDLEIIMKTLRILNNYEKLPFPVGINLCSETINKKDTAEIICRVIKENNTKHNSIVLELNEGTNFSSKYVRDNASYLSHNGVKIAIDDFGIENANLMVLMSYKIDILKIDKSLVDIEYDRFETKQEIILRYVRGMIKQLKIQHIIEGVETLKQLNELENTGFTTVQGFIHEKPVELNRYIIEREKDENFRILK